MKASQLGYGNIIVKVQYIESIVSNHAIQFKTNKNFVKLFSRFFYPFWFFLCSRLSECCNRESDTVCDGLVDGVREGADVLVDVRKTSRTALGTSTRQDAREVSGAIVGAGGPAATVALTEALVVRRTRAQHRRVHLKAHIFVPFSGARGVVHDARRHVQQNVGNRGFYAL